MKNNKRYLESMLPLFTDQFNPKTNTLFLMASDDEGVVRNLGRKGARFAPEAIVNTFKKMNNHFDYKHTIFAKEVFNNESETFEGKQIESSKLINELTKDHLKKNIVHIGGGHDHAYPFLKSLELNPKIKNILILNIDAHCDTRIDDFHHSGTPFRNFTDESKKNINLKQIGIHKFANSKSTLAPIKSGKEEHYYLPDLRVESDNFSNVHDSFFQDLGFELDDDTFVYLSLDCDAIESSVMEAVSAVNHDGLPLRYIELLINHIKNFNCPMAFGLYEYNPIFDNLSQKGARALCSLIYKWIK